MKQNAEPPKVSKAVEVQNGKHVPSKSVLKYGLYIIAVIYLCIELYSFSGKKLCIIIITLFISVET